MWEETQVSSLPLLSYIVCNIISSSFLSLHLMLSSILSFSRHPLLALHHYNRPCGKRNIKSPPFCKNPPFLSLIASLPKSNPYKYPLSFSLSSFTSLLLLCFLQPTEEPPREPPPLASSSTLSTSIYTTLTTTKHTTFNLPLSLCENRLLLLDWGRVSSPAAKLRVGALLLDLSLIHI